MYKDLKEKLLVKDRWIRGLLMLFFMLIKYIVSWLICIISLFQFVHDMLFDQPNDKLLEFSKQLNIYFLQILNFLTFNSHTPPFPFSDWPESKKIENYPDNDNK